MTKITVLDESTINQIAAGEVIERPAAVVKELVENSIDAGANAITVEIKEGGISFIRITDNGSGIDEEDMPLVFLRHSTSKIRTAEDLLSVSSLGFRGEALSSIAAIAQVELVTKTAEAFSGIRYQIAGGEEKSMEHIGCPGGTTFIARNLFYNTPARRKFLKSPVTEAGYISDLMERLSVSHPNVAFKFINNNQIKLHTSGNNNLKDIIYHVYGRDIASHLVTVEGDADGLSIDGFIAKPIVSRGNRNYENYFINGRYIKSSLISKAIEEAFRPFSMTHRYPFTCLHLHIPSELIDVNVHPAKLEIRFKNGDEVYRLVYHAVKNSLEGKELIPSVSLEDKSKEKVVITEKIPEPFEVNRRMEELKEKNENLVSNNNSLLNYGAGNKGSSSSYTYNRYMDAAGDLNLNNTPVSEETKELIKETEIGKFQEVVKTATPVIKETTQYNTLDTNDVSSDADKKESFFNDSSVIISKPEQLSFISEKAKENHRIVGQVFSTYWIVEFRDKMYLIDQHAAHEKVLYEKTMKALHEKQYNAQMLEPPVILSLSMREEEIIQKYSKELKRIGFEIEEFGGKEYAVRAIPGDLFGLAQKEILIEMIDELVDEAHNETPDIILEKIASVSCKAAVKGNHRISSQDASSLIDQLLTLENPYHCPHGRPTIISMSKYELEKKFKRIV
ncbi:DNA mismatch repair endonuclease MutL [Anaerocolumna sp.]|uniref:DNA mismatch repair endonuclease MutL n=1 Tax=Anaerocolumna sp. TaxID=2041569 RepID=UPI0028ACAB96|nr:DNA mismatch repair endonuclease MutL [Anaerocolumna sp.]